MEMRRNLEFNGFGGLGWEGTFEARLCRALSWPLCLGAVPVLSVVATGAVGSTPAPIRGAEWAGRP